MSLQRIGTLAGLNHGAMSDMQFTKTISIRRLAAGAARVLMCLALVAAITWATFSLLRVNSLIAGFSWQPRFHSASRFSSAAFPHASLSWPLTPRMCNGSR